MTWSALAGLRRPSKIQGALWTLSGKQPHRWSNSGRQWTRWSRSESDSTLEPDIIGIIERVLLCLYQLYKPKDEFGRVSTFRTISKSATFQAITDRFAGYQAERLNGRRHAPGSVGYEAHLNAKARGAVVHAPIRQFVSACSMMTEWS
jgi:hypothetical protein